jgi:YfiH family protein
MSDDLAPAVLKGQQARYLTFPNLVVSHGFSTRLGGVSQGPYQALNIGQTTCDHPRRVHENRLRLEREWGFPLVPVLNMVHGAHVVRLESQPPTRRIGDACITDRPGVALMITTADCVPILFHDPVRKAVGLAHAGWRGTLQGVARATVRAMAAEYGSCAADLQVAIGPAIGPCCFEVHEDVADPFLRRFPGKELVRGQGNRFNIDLWRANLEILLDVGVPEAQVCISRVCTSCREDLFYSYRRDQKVTGRMAAGICLP